jgi:hypothetical protein
MTEEHVGAVAERDGGATPYEKPSLVLVGNLNDLLAGGGSQEQDNGQTFCAGTGNDDNPDC